MADDSGTERTHHKPSMDWLMCSLTEHNVQQKYPPNLLLLNFPNSLGFPVRVNPLPPPETAQGHALPNAMIHAHAH